MQKKVQIVSDGSLDLPQEITDAHDIEVVPFYVSFNGETYQKEIEEIGIQGILSGNGRPPGCISKIIYAVSG